MKKKSNTGNCSIEQNKDSLNNWKCKAQLRSKENIALRKRIKELTASRDCWKTKYQLGWKKSCDFSLDSGLKAKQHQYNLSMILLLLNFYNYGTMSLRSCRHVISCLVLSSGLDFRTPSHVSIRNWLCKVGKYRVLSSVNHTGSYVLYVDESIVFGSEKILLILGVSESKIPTERSMAHSDVEVLYVGASSEWTGAQIAVHLSAISKHKTIDYVVSDQGNNLRNAYKTLSYSHIEDCTHLLANYLKALYGEDETFEQFRKLIGTLRKAWNLSKANSRYMPPSMRGKMRFANIFPCIKWAEKTLANWNNLSEEVQQQLAFLKEQVTFFTTLGQIAFIFKTVCEKLKNQGFGKLQKKAILDAFSKMKAEQKVEGKAAIFIENCEAYLEKLTLKSFALNKEHLICSSDIIESIFGKFKTKINPNNPTGVTEFMFTIANFSQNFSTEEIKNALEKIKLVELKI